MRSTPMSWRRGTRAGRELGSGNLELDADVVARRVRIRADLLVRLARERGELGLRQALVLDGELHREAEAPAVARADRDRTGDARLGSVLLLALADEVERAAEARRVAGGEEVLGRGRAELSRAAHFLRHREIRLHHAVARLGVAVAPAGGGRGCGEQGLDRVHAFSVRRVVDPSLWTRPAIGDGKINPALLRKPAPSIFSERSCR